VLIKALWGLRSPSGNGGRLSILIFHRVLPEADPLFPDEMHARRFDSLLGWLAQWSNVLPLTEAVDKLRSGTLPARAVAITFDDGYADNLTVAQPILARHRMSATVFVAPTYLDGGIMFNDVVTEAVRAYGGSILDLAPLGLGTHPTDSLEARRKAIQVILMNVKYLPLEERTHRVDEIAAIAGVTPRRDLMMTREQVGQLHKAGVGLGGHTASHPILAQLDPEQARAEIVEGKRQVEAIIDEPISLFAYPNGKPGKDYLAEHVAMVREAGFTAALSTAVGAARAGDDPFQLPRFTPWDRTALRFGLRLLRNMGHGGATA
jgi:peptidoglycan/xylan/chitin deacetylase (PgdA/CDA1 family)